MRAQIFYILFLALFQIQVAEPANPWILSSNYLPANVDLYASVGNGQMATLVLYPYYHIQGIYNGHDSKSNYAKMPNPLFFEASVIGGSKTYTLNLYQGYFSYQQTSGQVIVTSRIYCHRKYQTLMVKDITITRVGSGSMSSPISVPIINQFKQINITDILYGTQTVLNGQATMMNATVIQQELDGAPKPIIYITWSNVPTVLTLPANTMSATFTFAAAMVVNNKQKSLSDLSMAQGMIGNNTLLSSHTQAWSSIWSSGWRLYGNNTIATSVYAAYYYIYSSLPQPQPDYNWPFYGIAPCSLAHSDKSHAGLNGTGSYLGHIFWDQEIWMMPNILPFHPEIFKKVVKDVRIRRVHAAQMKADLWGFQGAMFPWEGAYTGFDVCPWFAATGHEVHINGDISVALKNYLVMADDADMALNGGYTLAYAVAQFWASKVIWYPSKQKWGAIDVIGPDEMHTFVANSAYTNAIASIALLIPSYIYNRYMKSTNVQPPPSKWAQIANNMYIPYDTSLDYHPEFDGYKLGTIVNQADVVLLQYPLGWQMAQSTRMNDLNFYQNATYIHGPAMTWPIYTINWLDMGNYAKATQLFWRAFNLMQQPFYVWTERYAPPAGAVNFVTGMGAFLQSMTYGYFGLRISDSSLMINPQPVPTVSSYSVQNLRYRSNVITFSVFKSIFTVWFVSSGLGRTLVFKGPTTQTLQPGQQATLPLGRYQMTEISGSSTTLGMSSTTAQTQSTTTYAPICNLKNLQYDVIFAIDSSTATGAVNYYLLKQMMATFANAYSISPSMTQVGMLSYDTVVLPYFALNTFNSAQQLQQALSMLRYTGSNGHNINGVLKFVQNTYMQSNNGYRPGIQHLLVLVTSGSYTGSAPYQLAQQLRSNGLHILAIGVGPQANMVQLQQIAGINCAAVFANGNQITSSMLQWIESKTCLKQWC